MLAAVQSEPRRFTAPPHSIPHGAATLGRGECGVRASFEIFPPKSPDADEALWSCIRRLEPLNPSFISVTFGANGSTRAPTRDVVSRLVRETGAPAAAHLTCVGADRAEIDAILGDYWDAGVRHIVALRGDAPQGRAGSASEAGHYANATQLTAAIRRFADFEVSVACYPEGHPESPSLAHDIDVLKAKQDAGASRAISQFFFDVDAFLRFAEKAVRAGVSIPILPGVMPVANFASVARMARTCGASVPNWVANMFEGLDDDPDTRRLVACSLAAETCARLQDEGFRQFHFYTLNRPEMAYAVCRRLGLRADATAKESVQ